MTVQSPRDVLSPEALTLLQAIAQAGSFAAAARQLGVVPSALTYRVRQIEEALDVLLFDRSARQARPTEAGRELLREGERLLAEMEAVANRVRRVATGWESQFTVAVDSIIAQPVIMELCADFLALRPPTRLRLRDETLSGTLQALTSGMADLAIGVGLDTSTLAGIVHQPLGRVAFVYAVAPHHPLATAPEPLGDELIQRHRAVAVADSVPVGGGITVGLLAGQDVLTVSTMDAKLDAQLRGLGGGFLPEPLARPYIESGRLVVRAVQRPSREAPLSYAWRSGRGGRRRPGAAVVAAAAGPARDPRRLVAARATGCAAGVECMPWRVIGMRDGAT
jgi:molybdate transport repressor ModE-like protein